MATKAIPDLDLFTHRRSSGTSSHRLIEQEEINTFARMPLVDNCLLPTRDYLFTLPLYHTLDNFRNLELLAKEYDFMEFSTMGPLQRKQNYDEPCQCERDMIKQSPKVEYEITKNPYLTQQVGRVQIGKSSLKTQISKPHKSPEPVHITTISRNPYLARNKAEKPINQLIQRINNTITSSHSPHIHSKVYETTVQLHSQEGKGNKEEIRQPISHLTSIGVATINGLVNGQAQFFTTKQIQTDPIQLQKHELDSSDFRDDAQFRKYLFKKMMQIKAINLCPFVESDININWDYVIAIDETKTHVASILPIIEEIINRK